MAQRALIFSLIIPAALLVGCSASPMTETGNEPSFAAGNSKPSSSKAPQPTEGASGLGARDKDDFKAAPKAHSTIDTYGVQSPDGRVRCFVQDNEKAPMCEVDYADPPYVPQVGLPQWRANFVSFADSRGFFPATKMGGEPIDYTTLNAGEAVSIGDKHFLSDQDGTFTVTYEGHHFKVDGGEYYSDTFPQKPDADGKAFPGTLCGEVSPRGDEHGWVYAAAAGTHCPAGLEAASGYTADDSRQQGSWQCRTGVLAGWPKDSEHRRLCTNGEQAVVIF